MNISSQKIFFMPAVSPETIQFASQSLVSLFYLLLAGYVLRHRHGQVRTAIQVAVYLAAASVIQLVEALQFAGWIRLPASGFLAEINLYSLLVTALLLYLAVRAFLRITYGEGWLYLWLVWTVILIGLANELIAIPELILALGSFSLSRSQLPAGMLWIGWGFFTILTLVTTMYQYRNTRQPLHRNRIGFLLPTLLLLMGNDLLILTGLSNAGGLLRVAGAVLLVYATVTHDLPELRDIFRRSLIYTVTGLLLIAVYLAGIGATEILLQPAGNVNSVLVGAFIALLLAIIFTPLLSLVRRVVNRLFLREHFSPTRTLREYSMSISNILEMNALADVAVGMILEAMAIDRGFLLLVDHLEQESGGKYRFRPVQSTALEKTFGEGTISENSPFAQYLLVEKQPLLQYDLDMLPPFQDTPEEEKEWLASLQAEVYVPIFSKREWIGMLALGTKLSGNRYSENDLETLSTIANQTAVALTNARLVENMYRVNRKLRSTLLELDMAKRHLERLDRTKSDFISIASHELRTPLTVVKGYIEMLMEEGTITEGELHNQVIRGIHDGTVRLNEIVESMFDLAQIDSRNLDLHLQNVDVAALVRLVCKLMERAAEERKQNLLVEVPELPTIRADPNSLKKVFQHLITNAIKFTPDGGTVTVSGQVFHPVPQELPEGGVEIVVSDTGVGVDPNLREMIFTKFFHEGDPLKHSSGKIKFKGRGAGLGLALARGIVEAHGGKIWVDSPGHDEEQFPGSQFHVVLPMRVPGGD